MIDADKQRLRDRVLLLQQWVDEFNSRHNQMLETLTRAQAEGTRLVLENRELKSRTQPL